MCDCAMEWTSYIFNALDSVMIFPRLANKSVIEKTQRQSKSEKIFIQQFIETYLTLNCHGIF